jgi:hypothetical protein
VDLTWAGQPEVRPSVKRQHELGEREVMEMKEANGCEDNLRRM